MMSPPGPDAGDSAAVQSSSVAVEKSASPSVRDLDVSSKEKRASSVEVLEADSSAEYIISSRHGCLH